MARDEDGYEIVPNLGSDEALEDGETCPSPVGMEMDAAQWRSLNQWIGDQG